MLKARDLLAAATEDRFSQRLPASVELRTADGRSLQAVVRALGTSTIEVEFSSHEGNDERLAPGHVVEVLTYNRPSGPVSASARVVSVNAARDHLGQPVRLADLDLLNSSDAQPLTGAGADGYPVIAAIGLDPQRVRWTDDIPVLPIDDDEKIPDILADCPAVVLVFGPGSPAERVVKILQRCRARFPDRKPPVVVILDHGSNCESLHEFVDEDRIFYLSREPLPEPQLQSIVRAAWQRTEAGAPNARSPLPEPAGTAVDFCVRLMDESTPEGAAGILIEAAEALIPGARAQCLLFDHGKDVLWSRDPVTRDERTESPSAGLIGYAARTGESIRVGRAAADPRFDAESDDPRGTSDPEFLAEPIPGVGGGVSGVLSVVRPGDMGPFTDEAPRTLRLLAVYGAPAAEAGRLRTGLQQALLRQSHSAPAEQLFRQEALAYHAQSLAEQGGLLMGPPRWLVRSHWLTLLLVAAVLVYMAIARIDERATGPALVRSRRKIAVSAGYGGLVRSIDVSVGDRVRAGDLLIRFHDLTGRSALDLFREQIRAPEEGMISDIRVRAGQEVAAGDQVANIVDEDAGYELIALLPGSFAPQLRSGMSVTLKLQGYPDSRETLPVDRVGGEIVGPREAARYLGKESAESLPVSGSIVIVRSTLRHAEFVAGGRALPYHDGMTGEAAVTLRSEPMIVSLIPGLRALLANR